MDLVADALGAEQAGIRELPQFPMQRSGGNPGEARNHPHVEAIARAQEQERQHAVAVGAEQQVRQQLLRGQWFGLRSQHCYDCSTTENDLPG
ncbi:MAG: hypothetical protein EXR33_00415 [Betaproteobacteria bacterium]|nr:hypothetical protein [Betaproteobacteria bacterium]